MQVFKVDFQNKAVTRTASNRTSKIQGTMYFKFQFDNHIPRIVSSQVILSSDNEFNLHQQPKWSKTKNSPRKRFADEYKISHIQSKRSLLVLTSEQTSWWNNEISNKISPLSISKYLTGNNPTGSQKKKSNAEFILSNGDKKGQPFFNLLKVFAKKSLIKTQPFSAKDKTEAMSFDEFMKDAAEINADVRNVFNNFFEKDFLYFYVEEMRENLDIENDADEASKLRRRFRTNLISKFDRVDQLYNVFSARKMVEAAHIKPFSHSTDNSEKIDIDNGILLSPDIHKLFDSGAICFSDEGKIMYTTNKSHAPYNLTKMEVQRLELDNHKLNKKLLTKERQKYLTYHREHIYRRGV